MSLFGSIIFKRFGRATGMPGFEYSTEDNAKDYENNPQVISMENVGFNLHVSIHNYMAESIMLGANVRSQPTKINSLLNNNMRPRHDQRNAVFIQIHSSENKLGSGQRGKPTQVRKSFIRIPGHMLQAGSVFIDELDCYITTEANLEATRELIARDVSDLQESESITVPMTAVTPNPTNLYADYKHLIDLCIRRQDRVQIRTGYDFHQGIVPDFIKNLHVSILDHYFVPFNYNKLVFDPTLSEDEFVIENLHLAAKEEFRFTFSELRRLGKVYISHELQNTLSGQFYGMAVFADEAQYAQYLYSRKTIDRFNEEQLFVAERSGDPLLRERIGTLEREIESHRLSITEKDDELSHLRAEKKRLQGELTTSERTITKLRDRADAKLDVDVIMRSMDNDAAKIDNETEKIKNDREDQEFRSQSAKASQHAARLKYLSEIMKSGWGIVTGCVAGVLTVFAVLKKFNVRVTMG